jgi:hypothetical protein
MISWRTKNPLGKVKRAKSENTDGVAPTKKAKALLSVGDLLKGNKIYRRNPVERVVPIRYARRPEVWEKVRRIGFHASGGQGLGW